MSEYYIAVRLRFHGEDYCWVHSFHLPEDQADLQYLKDFIMRRQDWDFGLLYEGVDRGAATREIVQKRTKQFRSLTHLLEDLFEEDKRLIIECQS